MMKLFILAQVVMSKQTVFCLSAYAFLCIRLPAPIERRDDEVDETESCLSAIGAATSTQLPIHNREIRYCEKHF